MLIRVASATDLDDIVRLQTLAYGEYFNESPESLLAKLMLADSSSFVSVIDENVCAYAIAFPWESGQPVVLHSVDIAPPSGADVMYVHDVAVAPQHHKKGIAKSLVDAIFARASELQLQQYELVAVQNSAEFWERNGFVEHGIAGTEYGDGAMKMVKN